MAFLEIIFYAGFDEDCDYKSRVGIVEVDLYKQRVKGFNIL